MSTCKAVRRELGGYVVGGLSEDEVARVQAHLEGCAPCRAELDALSALPALLELAADESPQVPSDLRDRAVARATAGSAAHGAGGAGAARRRTPALTAAAALVGLVVGVGAVLAAGADPPADAVVELATPTDGAGQRLEGEAALRDTDAGVRVDLRAAGLPVGDDVAYYHVWLEWPSGDWISAGTFRPGDDGRVRARLTCGGELADYAALTITAHPPDGDGHRLVRVALD